MKIEDKEKDALESVLADIVGSDDERGQNLAIERYLKLNMAIAMRSGNIDVKAITEVMAAMKPKQHT